MTYCMTLCMFVICGYFHRQLEHLENGWVPCYNAMYAEFNHVEIHTLSYQCCWIHNLDKINTLYCSSVHKQYYTIFHINNCPL